MQKVFSSVLFYAFTALSPVGSLAATMTGSEGANGPGLSGNDHSSFIKSDNISTTSNSEVCKSGSTLERAEVSCPVPESRPVPNPPASGNKPDHRQTPFKNGSPSQSPRSSEDFSPPPDNKPLANRKQTPFGNDSQFKNRRRKADEPFTPHREEKKKPHDPAVSRRDLIERNRQEERHTSSLKKRYFEGREKLKSMLISDYGLKDGQTLAEILQTARQHGLSDEAILEEIYILVDSLQKESQLIESNQKMLDFLEYIFAELAPDPLGPVWPDRMGVTPKARAIEDPTSPEYKLLNLIERLKEACRPPYIQNTEYDPNLLYNNNPVDTPVYFGNPDYITITIDANGNLIYPREGVSRPPHRGPSECLSDGIKRDVKGNPIYPKQEVEDPSHHRPPECWSDGRIGIDADGNAIYPKQEVERPSHRGPSECLSDGRIGTDADGNAIYPKQKVERPSHPGLPECASDGRIGTDADGNAIYPTHWLDEGLKNLTQSSLQGTKSNTPTLPGADEVSLFSSYNISRAKVR